MAWRFKASKYKNVAPKFPKREEWISDIAIGTLMQSCGNHIKAGCVYMAFNVASSGGGNLAVLPVGTKGRVANGAPLLYAHGDYVTDFDFSPFDDYLLATGSADCGVKVWLLPTEDNLSSAMSTLNPVVSLPGQDRRIENVLWNPVAEGVLAASTHDQVKIFDVTSGAEKIALSGHKDQIQSISWRGDGSSLVTSCKDKYIRIFDPRSGAVLQEGQGHGNPKDFRVVWLGDKDYIVTAGCNTTRERELKCWDCRNLKTSIARTDLDNAAGHMIPLYDCDTGMLFLTGKGDTTIKYLEVLEKDPYFQLNCVDRTEQVRGAALVPKHILDVMNGEVDRMLILTNHNIIPTPYIVPRKSYRDFLDDVFPDTPSKDPALNSAQWFSGQNSKPNLTTLNPAKTAVQKDRRGQMLETKGSSAIQTTSQTPKEQSTTQSKVEEIVPKQQAEDKVQTVKVPEPVPEPVPEAEPEVVHVNEQVSGSDVSQETSSIPATQTEQLVTAEPHNETDDDKWHDIQDSNTEDAAKEEATPNLQDIQKKIFTSVRQSKFKHLNCKVLHKSTHIDNIRRLSTKEPGESDMFHANKTRCVVPVEGSGGLLTVLELNKPGRLPDTGVPVLQHGSTVTDFTWDPFDDNRLVVACDDAKIHVWDLPDGGVTETMTESSFCLLGHMEKIYFVKFHPLAKDVIVSSAYDTSVRIWDLAERQEKIQLEEHPDQVFCAEWSPDGKYLATVCKDTKIRIFNVRKSPSALVEGPGPQGSRGARIVWALDGQYLVVSGFNNRSTRTISVHDTGDLSAPLYVHELDTTPAILVPFYDEDSSTVFLTGRGDSLVIAFEVAEEEPYLFQLSTSNPEGLHQAISFLPKRECNVRQVEFAKAWRLTNTSVEPLSFTVPRVRKEYFQDDIFPDTKVTWEPVMSAADWFSGMNRSQKKISLKPKDMISLSEAPVEAPKVKKYDSYNPDTYKTDEQKKEELISAMTNKLTLQEDPLPQDIAEGVDSDEWDDY